MRIGIITQPIGHNYGGILQNYALQQVLKRLHHKPCTIDFVSPRHWGERIKHVLWSWVHFRGPNRWLDIRKKTVKKFIHKYIKTTFPIRKYRKSVVRLYGFDALIAGSDQIWRPLYNDETLYDMYFKFAEDLPVKKIVYAASFGTDEWEYDPEQMRYCRSLAQGIDALSVREKSGGDLCRQYLGVEVQWVLDPTLLLDKTDYERICALIPRTEWSFIAAYILDKDKRIAEKINQIGKSLDLPVQSFPTDDLTFPVEEWLAMFRDAKYVITDSFHGVVFSIIFNKPFITIGNMRRGMSRFYSLLEQFGLEKRLSPDISAEDLLKPILWDEINRKKRLFMDSSIAFLEKALK